MSKRKIGISCLCYGLFPLFRGPWHVLDLAESDGLDGLQLLPIWFWSKKSLENLPEEEIFSYEDSWNGGSYLKTLHNTVLFFRHYGPLPLIWDLGLFMGIFGISQPKVKFLEKTFPDAVQIDTHWPGSVPESQPYGDDSWLESGPVVADTFHILEKCNFDEDKALAMIAQIAPRVELIHFQMRSRPSTNTMLADFINGTGYLHNAMKILTTEKPDTTIILETMRFYVHSKNYTLTDIAQKLREY